jgi:hypothetical protein
MQSVGRQSARRTDVVSTTFPDADSNKEPTKSPEAADADKKKRTSKGLKLIILTAGLLVTFAWMGFLAWAASRIVSGW